MAAHSTKQRTSVRELIWNYLDWAASNPFLSSIANCSIENLIFPCLFGCQVRQRYFGMIRSPHPTLDSDSPPPDDFAHYLICPKLWHLIDSVVTHSVPIDPLKRLGLIDPNYDNLFTLACSFHAYHAIKHVRNSPPSSLDFTSNSRLFAEAFLAAAHIVGLQYTRDSVDALGA